MVSVQCVRHVMAKMSVCAACDCGSVKIHNACCDEEFPLKTVCYKDNEKGRTPTNTLTIVIKWTLHRNGDMSRLMVGVYTIVNSWTRSQGSYQVTVNTQNFTRSFAFLCV